MTEWEALRIALWVLRDHIADEVETANRMAIYGKQMQETWRTIIDPLMEAQEVIYKMVEVVW